MVTRRRFLAVASAASAVLARPALASAPVELKRVRIGSILAGTTMAGELLPKYLAEAGVQAEVVTFPNIVQRMQAVASGDVQIGYGGINAAIGLAGRGFPLVLLANACDGGYAVMARPGIAGLPELAGRKVAVQFGSIPYATLQWKLRDLGLDGKVELLNLNIQDMPIALQRGDVDAMYAIEPYPSMVAANGWGQRIWLPYDTPVGKTNLGFVASREFVDKYPILTRAVLAAHRRATADLVADSSLAADTVAKTLNMPPEVARMAMENIFFSTESGPEFQASVKAMGNLMLEANLTDKLPDWDAFIQTELA